MGAMWDFFICVLTVWLAKGSCLPVGGTNKRNEHALQRKMEDLSPNELSLKTAVALLQSMESMLGEQEAKEALSVQLETNDVEGESSVGHVKPVQLKTEKDVPVGTAVDRGTLTFTFTLPFGGGTVSGTFPAGGSASTSGGISNNNGSRRVANDRGGIFAGNGGGNSGIFGGNGGSNSGIFAGNGGGNSGIFAGNGGGNSGIVAGNGGGNSGIVAGNGGGNSGIVAGNAGGNFLPPSLGNFLPPSLGNFLPPIFGNFAGDSSHVNGSHSAGDGSSHVNGSHSAGSGSYVNGSAADGGIIAGNGGIFAFPS